MKMYEHILLATDLSSENQDTLQKAKQLAEFFGAKLSLFHAVEPIPNYGYVGITDLEAKTALGKLGQQLSAPASDQWVSVGPAKREILATIKELHIDLLIIGSHSGHHLSEILGSTTNGVLHHSVCDILTVRHGQE